LFISTKQTYRKFQIGVEGSRKWYHVKMANEIKAIRDELKNWKLIKKGK